MISRAFAYWSLLVFLPAQWVKASPAGTNLLPCRLTVELRDGSRVVGRNESETLKFHSPLLGNLKLAIQDIRSVECLTSNSVKLTTTGGDVLTVAFADARLNLKTSFGKIELAADSIRRLTVTTSGTSGARLPGLVALWSGEDNGRDSSGNHEAEWVNVAYTDGQVGRGFSLNGYSSWATLPSSRGLDFANAEGLTIMSWIKPNQVDGFHPILEWEVTREKNAVQLWIGHLPQDRGVVAGYIANTDRTGNELVSPPGTLVAGQFQHVAMTYDKNSGVAKLLVNGRVVAQENIGTVTPDTSGPLFFSRRPCDQPGDWTYDKFFSGVLDEVSIYKRGLTTEEIRDICTKENNGELPPAPPSHPPRQNFPSGSGMLFSE